MEMLKRIQKFNIPGREVKRIKVATIFLLKKKCATKNISRRIGTFFFSNTPVYLLWNSFHLADRQRIRK